MKHAIFSTILFYCIIFVLSFISVKIVCCSCLFLVATAAEKIGIISLEEVDMTKESEKDKTLRTLKKYEYPIEE